MTTPPRAHTPISSTLIAHSGYANPGFAARYARYRPHPPAELVGLLTRFAGLDRPRLVVDLGSGTGLSALLWAAHADTVVGVEPNDAMRALAAEQTAARGLTTVRYQGNYANTTGLPAGTADIVTCAQAFHWMEPTSTLAEVARLLRPGGLFAIYDYELPPTVHWEVEQAFAATFTRAIERVIATARARGGDDIIQPKEAHLAWLRESGHFRYAREMAFHAADAGDAERLVGLALSTGRVERALAEGASPEDLGLPALQAVADRILGTEARPWSISYRLWLAIK